MNLDQIATKCFILALFIRDDGQRLLLGDGYYDFNQKLQHFQSNTIANDVVEIQGDNGQLLAGQVMRSGAQKFEGYIGDATTNRQTIEQKRSDFMAFFRIKHFYKVIYIFPDGTAIQRQRGYLTDAPTIPEIFQKFPEYSVALNFEDANYYEYAEDEHGDEIYAHIAELALAGEAKGGLVWDAIGAVTNGITWSGIQTAQGEYIQITNELSLEAPLASVEMLGNATQTGTPTPDYPQPISVVTGENVVKIEGKNLCPDTSEGYWVGSGGTNAGRTANDSGVAIPVQPNTYYAVSTTTTQARYRCAWSDNTTTIGGASLTTASFFSADNTSGSHTGSSGSHKYLIINATDLSAIQLELGSTATDYEPYQGQDYEVNLGKNLLDTSTLEQGSFNYYTNVDNSDRNRIRSGLIPCQPNTQYSISANSNLGEVGVVYLESDGTTPIVGIGATPTGKTYSFTTKANVYYLRVRVGNTSNPFVVGTDYNLQLELGPVTSYAPYFSPIALAGVGEIQPDGLPKYRDSFKKTDGKWCIEKHTAKIASYAGETISTDYISTTGSLTTGATVYYALATPTTTEITNEALIAQLEALGASSLYLGVNNIGTETLNAVPTLKIEYYTEVDLDGAGYEWEPGGNTAKTIVTVAGVDSAWPIWTIQGGAQNPTLTNITTGQTITWQGFVPEGQTLTINMAEMTADLAGANVFEYITGEWLRLAPGNNTLVYNAGNADKPSTLSWNGVLA